MSSKHPTPQNPRTAAAPGPARPRPAGLTAAAVLTGLEGLVLAAAGVLLLVMGLLGTPDSPRQAETGGLTVLVLALLPLLAARGLWLLRRWSRGPAVITQIMALPVAWTLFNGGGLMVAGAVALALAAVATLVLLVNPTATGALGAGPREG
ncbi:hypothetical protein GCM10010218_36590 [Streptomyces mashuensis]|uniref:Integral membrane protein n=1 Tax=Streptomyces mashuensis TaxID=33904 RepID=A0A919B4W3_9ACTN|nr:hypothetical protein [Streptomyces mashuensis]GHF51644.1 hypothetical protein GCM10010218_36590 [Streptomyces mashuensis]